MALLLLLRLLLPFLPVFLKRGETRRENVGKCEEGGGVEGGREGGGVGLLYVVAVRQKSLDAMQSTPI